MPEASQRPTKLATEPGAQLIVVGWVGIVTLGGTACGAWLPALRRSVITGLPGSASITTEPLADIWAESVAVNVTSRLSNGYSFPTW